MALRFPSFAGKAKSAVVGGLVALSAITIAACGGGSRQDENEPKGTFTVDVISAKFPGRQYLGAKTKLTVTVRNPGKTDVPNLTVTIDGLSRRLNDPTLADPERPVWVVDSGPRNSTTAYTNTWAVGKLEAGKTETLTWNVTSASPGTYSVRYQVAGGLNGKAKVVQTDGSAAKGSLLAHVSSKPRPVPDPIN